MGDIKVYKMNDYEWWASDLTAEETNAFYKKEIGEENSIEEIEECDIDKEGLWWVLEPETEEHKKAMVALNGKHTTYPGRNRKIGDLSNDNGTITKFISLRDAIERSGEYTEPFCIASTEW